MHRMLLHSLIVLTPLACTLIGASDSLAANRDVDFLKALQKKGYGEMAVYYLEQLKANKLPPELEDKFDLEMSTSLRLSIPEAYNKEEAEQRTVNSKKFLETYRNAHPGDADAVSTSADAAFDRGLALIRSAKATKDKEQIAKHLADARAALDESRPLYQQAADLLDKKFQELKDALGGGKGKGKAKATTSKSKAEREEALDAYTSLMEARFKVAMVDYYKGQTYVDDKDPERKAALVAAAKSYDTIFQDNRDAMVGLYAHMWEGRTHDDMGDYQTALDIYEEVLANAPPTKESSPLDPVFAQVEYFRFLIVHKTEPKKFQAEAKEWLQTNKQKLQKLDGFQGVQLELAKAVLEDADRASEEQKSKLRRDAQALLKEVAKVNTPHAIDAKRMMQGLKGGGSGEGPVEASNFEEAFAMAKEAASSGEVEAAIKALEQAVEFAPKAKDKKQVNDVKDLLDKMHFRRALALYTEGKYDEAWKIVAPLAKKTDNDVAPSAASLGVSCALSIYQSAEDKDAAMKKLTAISDYTIKTWPDKAEADDARIALGQASLMQQDFAKAIEVFENVNPPRSAIRSPYTWPARLTGDSTTTATRVATSTKTRRPSSTPSVTRPKSCWLRVSNCSASSRVTISGRSN